MRTLILQILDLFYLPFKKLMNKQTYYYAACGGGNLVLDLLLYYVSFHYIFKKEVFHVFGKLAFEPYIAAFLFAFIITFPIGFALSKYVVWTESNIKGRIQLFRYFVIVLINLLLNYALLKIFIEVFGIFPTISKALTIIIVTVFSYLSQKHYTFKIKKEH